MCIETLLRTLKCLLTFTKEQMFNLSYFLKSKTKAGIKQHRRADFVTFSP